MATVNGTLMLNTGELVELSSTLTNGTEAEVQVSTNYAVAATSLGQFADGKTITAVLTPIQSDASISYAYIDRRGEIAAILPVAVAGQVAHVGGACGFTLQAGDTVRALSLTTTSRAFAYMVNTNAGISAIFVGTPTGAGDVSLTHLKSGQGLGTSLVNQTITQHVATSVDGAKLTSGGVLLLNDRGLPQGGVPATSPQQQQPMMTSMGGARIALNWVARVSTSS